MRWLIGIILLVIVVKLLSKGKWNKSEDLIILRLELDRLLTAKRISEDDYAQLTKHIDNMWSSIVDNKGVKLGSNAWLQRRAAAWEELERWLGHSPGQPPWLHVPKPKPELAPLPPKPAVVPPPIPKRTPAPPILPHTVTSHAVYDSVVIKSGKDKPLPEPPPIEKPSDESTRFAWKAKKPGALERAMQSVSGLSSLIVPFLSQNIGWFISGFSFVAGSVFLITYTAGFTRSLIISGSFFAYTLLVLIGAYQLLKRRAELRMASSVLLTLGMLFIPLSIAASVRVVDVNFPAVPATITGIFLVMINIGTFYWAVQVASGIIDRTLQGAHSRLFFFLSGIQLAVPLLSRFSRWHLAAFLNLVILAVLSYGLVSFIRDWLKSIFLDRRKVAYYAAGTLVYAALVSFVHLLWRYQSPLPDGYAGPFVMILSGLLFYIDSHFKQWVHQYTYLSRFTFAVYGISILSLVITFNAPAARLITLALGIIVYGIVVWYYLTLPPLYLMLATMASLYGLLILKHVPAETYFLTSIPGLACVLGMQRLAVRRNSAQITLVLYRTLILLIIGLALWSFYHAKPGLIATATGLAVMGHWSLLFGRWSLKADDKWQMTNRFYTITISAAVTLAYLPLFTSFGWSRQFGLCLCILAGFWTWIGAKRQNIILLNSALLNIFTAIFISFLGNNLTPSAFNIVILAMSTGIFFWQSLVLRVQGIFYGALILGGAAGALFKMTYFPGPSVAIAEMLFAYAIWIYLWRLERLPEDLLRQMKENNEVLSVPQMTLLWMFPVRSLTLPEIVKPPLQQAMIVLWAFALFRLGTYLPAHTPTIAWGLNAGLGTILTMLLAARFRMLILLPAPLLTGLCAILSLIYQVTGLNIFVFSSTAGLYALTIWIGIRKSMDWQFAIRLADILHVRQEGSQQLIEHGTFWTSYGIIILSMLFSGYLWMIRPGMGILPTLAAAMVFLWLASLHHQSPSLSYHTLTVMVMAAIIVQVRILGISKLIGLPEDVRFGFLFILLSLGMCITGWILDRRADIYKETSSDFDQSLYRKPLRISAVILALIGGIQNLILIWGNTAISPLIAVNLLIAGIGLLIAAHSLQKSKLSLAGFFLIFLSLLCVEILIVHPGSTLTVWQSSEDQWLFIACLSLTMAVLSFVLSRYSEWNSLYAQPLRQVAILSYGLALLKGTVIFGMLLLQLQVSGFMPIFFVILAIELFPLFPTSPPFITGVERTDFAFRFRGASIAILLSMAVLSAVVLAGSRFYPMALIWAYMLWILANFALPSFNKRLPQWSVDPFVWPWLGLFVLILHKFFITGAAPDFLYWLNWVYLSVYCFLLLRNSDMPLLPWIAVGSLSFAGILIIQNMTWEKNVWELTKFIIGVTVWANLLLTAVPFWRRHGKALKNFLSWKDHNLDAPFLVIPFLIIAVNLFLLVFSESFALVAHDRLFIETSSLLWIAILLSLSFAHLFGLSRISLYAHGLLLSLFCIALTLTINYPAGFFHLPMVMSLWSGLLFVISIRLTKTQQFKSMASLSQAISSWLSFCPWIALAALVILPVRTLADTLLVLALLTVLFAGLGWQRRELFLLWTAQSLGLILLHTWPMLFVPSKTAEGLRLWEIVGLIIVKINQIEVLLPWYALQLTIVIWLIIGLRRVLNNWLTQLLISEFNLVSSFIRLISIIAIGEWVLHALIFYNKLNPMSPPDAAIHGIAALTAGILLILLGIRQAARTQDSLWVYGSALMTASAGVYLRLLCFGSTPPMLLDTAVLLGSAYAIFLLERLISLPMLSGPLLRFSMLLPFFALMTVPWKMASTNTAGVLLITGTLYLSIYQSTKKSLLLYLAVLMMNASIYLWIPIWARRYALIQLYVVPAALSVLLLLHLHRKELKRSVLNGTRLAAVSGLYASAAVDVFLRPELSIFVLALALSLFGIIIGIATRIRAFLYGGVIFMIINVAGQLIRFYPEHRLGKGILLVALGTVIMVSMIWFNIKREEILNRIRVFRADLEEWD